MRRERLVLIDDGVPFAVENSLDVSRWVNPPVEEPVETSPRPRVVVKVVALDQHPRRLAPDLSAGTRTLMVLTLGDKAGGTKELVRP